MEKKYPSPWFFHRLINSDDALMGSNGLEKGVMVALPPGSGEILPMDDATSQNLMRWSSPEVHIWVGASVDDVGVANFP